MRTGRAIITASVVAFAAATTWVSSPVRAQATAATTSAATSDAIAASADDIKVRINLLKARSDLADGERDLVLEQLNAALARTQSAKAAVKATEDYSAVLESAPETVATLTAQLTRMEEGGPAEALVDTDITRAQLRLAALQASAVKLSSEQRKLDESIASMATRPAQARDELVALRAELNNVSSVVAATASALVIEASRLRENAARRDLSARIDKIEQELLTLPARESIARAQRDIAKRQLGQVMTTTEALSARITAQREAAAQQKVRDAQAAVEELANQPAELRDYAVETTQLRATALKLSQQLEIERGKRERLRAELERIASARSNAEQILAIGRIDDEYGRILRGIEKDLPTVVTVQRRIAKRADVVLDARVQRLQAQQQLRELEDPAAAATALLAAAGAGATAEHAAIAAELIDARRSALRDMQDLLGQHVERLGEANATDTQLLQSTAQLRDFLTSRLLWLPSAAAVSVGWFSGQIGPNLVWLFSARNLQQIPVVLAQQFQRHWIVLTMLLLVTTTLLIGRRRLVHSLERLARPVGHRGDGLRFTLLAELASLLIALPPPLIFGTLGLMLSSADSAATYARSMGAGLVNAAAALLLLGIFQAMCRKFGVFTAHFDWDERGTRRLGRALHLLALAVAPGAFLKGMADSVGTTDMVEGIGRLGFMVVSLALALFMYRVFRPYDGALTVGLERDRFIWRTRHIWFWGLVAVPLVLALLSAVGYYATASQLQSRLFTTGWILLATVILYRTAMRGVIVSGRRTAYEQAEARHAKARADAIRKPDDTDVSEGVPELSEEPDIDVVHVSRQTRSLLRATSAVVLLFLLWGIWKGMLPVLDLLDQVVLWSHVVTTPAGDAIANISLFDLMRAVLIVILTVVAARNLPGFLEITVLQRLRIDSGARYATSTMGRYLILMVGLLAAINGIGADWSKLQWIVAALGVGLGFGLQEIVANFVSGIIILFERPVRVGDLVSIGTNTGTVTRIQIRAITITDFDNFEVLVPNKAFITGPVQNWSLTSPITRLLIKVGVAYGSNVEQVQKLILDAATSNSKVLKTPPPSALFVNFGDSALDFELRAFVGRIDHRLGTTHELLMAIEAAFKSAGIEVPFPQRDLHLRSSVVGLNREDPRSDEVP